MAASYQDFTGTTSKVKDFTFPYIKQSDIKVRKTTAAGVVTELVEGVLTSQSPGQYTWTNATRITTNDAPVSGDTIRVYRDTASDALVGTFYPGSAIRSSDLNDNFTQNLYVTQEAEDSVDSAVTDAASAKTTATTANTTAAAAETKANTAISTANTASTNATSAVSTANTASTNAASAVTTANNASTTATSAEAAVSSVLPYTIVANKAALLSASVSEDDIYEVTNTTDLEDLGGGSDIIWVNAAGSTSGQDIAALKPNVTWDSGITLKMKKYGTNNTDRKWIFQSYFANDPETKYAPAASPTFTGTVAIPNIANVETAITAKAPLASPTFTGTVAIPNIANVETAITAKAPLASPALTGTATGVNLTLSGDLTVNGTTTTIDTTNLTVEDPLISLAKNNNSSNTVDIGFYGLYDATGSQDVYTGLFRDANDSGKWKLFELNQAAPTTTVDVSGTGYAAATLVVGTLEDSKGNVREITENAKTTNYTLVAADAGKHIKFTPGDASQTLTVPDSVFSSGDAITIVNNSGNNLAIAKGTNMYYAADATNANRTLAGRGIATLLFIAADTCYITGAGLS